MSSLLEQLDNEILPALFQVLPDALPEFGFRKSGKGYKSSTGWKVTHEQGDDKDSVSVLEEVPFYLKDWTRSGKSIYAYVKERDNLTTYPEVVKRLAELAGVTVREQQLSPEDAERIEKARRVSDAWEAANEFFIACLSLKGQHYAETAPAAKRVREYLEVGRGYHSVLFRRSGQAQDRDTPKMEVGYIPGLGELAAHLREKEFTQDEVNVIVKSIDHSGSRVGTHNILTFPYRDHYGKIRGMVFRSILKDDEPKYLYSQFKRNEVLFNLRALAKDKDLVLVEAPLDAMHAAALGIKNIVALGGAGNTLNAPQLDLAIKYGATKVTLMLDNDRAGNVGTDDALNTIRRYAPKLRVFIAQYPDGIKDLDELLIKGGVDGFETMKGDALPAWQYLQNKIFTRYESLMKETGTLTEKQTEQLQFDLVETAARLDPIDNDRFTTAYISHPAIQELGISRQSADAITKAIREAEFNKRQADSLQTLLREAKKAGDSGEITEALDKLQREAKEIKARSKADSFAKLTQIFGRQELEEAIRNSPPVLETGLSLGQRDPLLISSSAITLIAGNTGSGKSILLANLALNMAELYPQKTFHIFSYEINRAKYLTNLLNSYIGDNDLAFNNRESIDHFFRGETKIVRKGTGNQYPLFTNAKTTVFHHNMEAFFSNLIDTGRIRVHYADYDSDTLVDAIEHLNKTEDVGAILIDYIQLIAAPVGKLGKSSRQEELKYMCKQFNSLAIDTGLPLIFGAQFNREVNNIAQMKDSALGEAGDLERISDQILGIWNGQKKWKGPPSGPDLKLIKAKLHGDEELDPETWYVEALKRRLGAADACSIWDYMPNAAKVTSR